MYKIDRRGGVQKSYTRTDPAVKKHGYNTRKDRSQKKLIIKKASQSL